MNTPPAVGHHEYHDQEAAARCDGHPPGPWQGATTRPIEDLFETYDGTSVQWPEDGDEDGNAVIVLCAEQVREMFAGVWMCRPWRELVADIERLSTDVEDARFWARHYALGAFVRDLEPPAWLTDSLDDL